MVSIDEKADRDYLMLERGQMPEVKVRDPHMELAQAISVKFEERKSLYSPEIVSLFESYIQKHLNYLQSEQEIKQMSQPMLPVAASPEELAGSVGTDLEGIVPETMGTGGVENYNLGNISNRT